MTFPFKGAAGSRPDMSEEIIWKNGRKKRDLRRYGLHQ
jgi:hypothetical protein